VKIFSKKFGETVYSLNWLPFGGFVKLTGEDEAEEISAEDGGEKAEGEVVEVETEEEIITMNDSSGNSAKITK
jgi:membrane-associated protease RseP (regulator of RpoE activity)